MIARVAGDGLLLFVRSVAVGEPPKSALLITKFADDLLSWNKLLSSFCGNKISKGSCCQSQKKIEESLNFKEAATRTFFLSGFCSVFSFSFSQIVLKFPFLHPLSIIS